MSLRAHAIAGVAALALCLASASAHELEMNTARVTMRDGNVVIHAEVDVVAWLDSLGEDPSQRDPSQPFALASVDPAQLAERSAQARRELIRDLRVEIEHGARAPPRACPPGQLVVRRSPHLNVAVGFARPAADVASRSPARAVS